MNADFHLLYFARSPIFLILILSTHITTMRHPPPTGGDHTTDSHTTGPRPYADRSETGLYPPTTIELRTRYNYSRTPRLIMLPRTRPQYGLEHGRFPSAVTSPTVGGHLSQRTTVHHIRHGPSPTLIEGGRHDGKGGGGGRHGGMGGGGECNEGEGGGDGRGGGG